MAELTVPLLNFSALGQLPQIIQQNQDRQGLKNAFAGGIGSDPQSLATLAQRVAPYNPQLAVNLAQLSHSYTRQGAQDARQAGLDTFNQNIEREKLELARRAASRADEDKFTVKDVTDPNTGATSFVKVNTRTGEIAPTGPQAPASTPSNPFAYPGAKPQTEAQSKDSGYANRMFRAEGVLRDPETIEAATSLGQNGLNAVPIAGNYLTSPAFQRYDQAKRDFVNAVLRRESGAAISESEFKNAEKQYFPQPGDSKERILEKQRNRQDTLASIAGGGGPNYRPPFTFGPNGELIETGAGKQGTAKVSGPTGPTRQLTQEPAARPAPQDAQGFRAPPKVGELRDGYRYKGGNPGDPANWVKQQSFDDRFSAAYSGSR